MLAASKTYDGFVCSSDEQNIVKTLGVNKVSILLLSQKFAILIPAKLICLNSLDKAFFLQKCINIFLISAQKICCGYT